MFTDKLLSPIGRSVDHSHRLRVLRRIVVRQVPHQHIGIQPNHPPPSELRMHASSDGLVHLLRRHRTLHSTIEESTELSHMTHNRLDDDRAIFLNDEAETISRVDTEMLTYFLGIVTWPFIVKVAIGIWLPPYAISNTLPCCKEQLARVSLGAVPRTCALWYATYRQPDGGPRNVPSLGRPDDHAARS